MLHDMRMDGQPLGSIDFNKLLPMPKELDMEAGTRTDRGLKLVREYHHTLADLERQKPGLIVSRHFRASAMTSAWSCSMVGIGSPWDL